MCVGMESAYIYVGMESTRTSQLQIKPAKQTKEGFEKHGAKAVKSFGPGTTQYPEDPKTAQMMH